MWERCRCHLKVWTAVGRRDERSCVCVCQVGRQLTAYCRCSFRSPTHTCAQTHNTLKESVTLFACQSVCLSVQAETIGQCAEQQVSLNNTAVLWSSCHMSPPAPPLLSLSPPPPPAIHHCLSLHLSYHLLLSPCFPYPHPLISIRVFGSCLMSII